MNVLAFVVTAVVIAIAGLTFTNSNSPLKAFLTAGITAAVLSPIFDVLVSLFVRDYDHSLTAMAARAAVSVGFSCMLVFVVIYLDVHARRNQLGSEEAE